MLLFTWCTIICIKAQVTGSAIQWQRSFGGSYDDIGRSIWQTNDCGYIIAGVSPFNGSYDYWIIKSDSMGMIEWQKPFGGSGDDEATCIQQTTDGGYIVAGYSESNDGDVTGHHGVSYNYDYWIVKLNVKGTIEWQKSLGGNNSDQANSIQQTTDGGYIVAGWTESIDGDVTGKHGNYYSDCWIVKLDGTGTIQWQKALGGKNEDQANSIQQTIDGGYIVAGSSASNNGDVSGHHSGDNNATDYWIVRLDNTGNILWQRSLGGSGSDVAWSIQQTTDSGYIVAGNSASNDGDVSGNHGRGDYWIVKLSGQGIIKWQKSLGGMLDDFAKSIQQTQDGGYIVAGSSGSNDADVSGNHGGNDYWLLKLDKKGNIQKEKSFGGSDDDRAWSILQTKDGGCIVAGYSKSNDGNVREHHGSAGYSDYWIVKFKSFDPIPASAIFLKAAASQNTRLLLSPNPSANGIFTIDMGKVNNNILVTVTDNMGRQVYAEKLSSAQQLTIRLNNKPKGSYYVCLYYNGGKQTATLLIE